MSDLQKLEAYIQDLEAQLADCKEQSALYKAWFETFADASVRRHSFVNYLFRVLSEEQCAALDPDQLKNWRSQFDTPNDKCRGQAFDCLARIARVVQATDAEWHCIAQFYFGSQINNALSSLTPEDRALIDALK